MNCPDKVSVALLRILELGLLRIRATALAGDSEQCEVEADHLHNLPQLLISFKQDLLVYYLTVERPTFATRSRKDTKNFESLWQELDSWT